MKLKIIPPRRPPHILSSDEISAAEALLMLAHCRDDSSSPPDSQATIHRTTDYNSAAPTTIVSKKRSTTAVSGQSPMTSGKANHECFICHKVFSSGQALGGHKTTHRRIKSPHGGATRPCNDAADAPMTILNRISFCCKKRKHDNYEGKLGIKMMISDSSDGINNSGVTSSDEGASNTRVRLDIDLNLPPPPESC